jgi:hypothetical protein
MILLYFFLSFGAYLPTLSLKCARAVKDLSKEAFLEVVVTRAQLAHWFDHLYDDGFSWLSEQGGSRFASMLDKTVVVARHCESTYQVPRRPRAVSSCHLVKDTQTSIQPVT